MNVLVISTGGTIASTANARGALVPTLTGEELVARCGTTRQVRAIDVASLDSSSMGLAEIDMLRETVRTSLLDDSASLVITHGTDSMAETALALDFVHADPRPVVLTGAMRSADHAHPDGPANLRGAIEVAATRRDTGVLVHFAGETLPARGLMKTQTTAEHAFTLTSGSPLPRPMAVPPAPLAGLSIPIIRAWAGADDALIRALGPIDGLVLEALGSGNVSACMGGAVAKLLRRGVPVVVATSVPYGEVSFAYGGAGGGSTLGDLGALPAGYLSASQARIALATALASGVNPSSLL